MKRWAKKTGRRLLCLVLCLAMLATVVFADDWYLDDGDIHISATESGQTVSQNQSDGVVSKADANPTIHGSNIGGELCSAPAPATPADPAAPAEKTESGAPAAGGENTPAPEDFKASVTVDTKGGATANMTLDNVWIEERDRSAIEVGDSNVNITVNGDSFVSTRDPDHAAIHVNSGSVTITGTAEDDKDIPQKESLMSESDHEIKDTNDNLFVSSEGRYTSDGAAIGSDSGEDFSGKITVEGNVAVNAYSDNGAAIGSGAEANVTKDAEITIKDDAKVYVESDTGADIGSGTASAPEVVVSAEAKADKENSELYPNNNNTTAMSGSITITGNSTVAAGDTELGAGIGSGAFSKMDGSIHVGGTSLVLLNTESEGAGIGSGVVGDVFGTITVDGNSSVKTYGHSVGRRGPVGSGARIGSGMFGFMNGTIRLDGNSNLSLQGCGNGVPEIGGGMVDRYSYNELASYAGETYIGSGVTINGDGTPVHIGFYKSGHDNDMFDISKHGLGVREMLNEVPLYSSITIEKGAHICGVEILDHKDADPYLHCLVDTEKGDGEQMYHYHVYIMDPARSEEMRANSLYWVTENEKLISYAEERNGDVLTVISEKKAAEFRSTVYGLNILQKRGVKTIVFKTADLESSFDIAEVTKGQTGSAGVVLSHTGSQARLMVGNQDLSKLLK